MAILRFAVHALLFVVIHSFHNYSTLSLVALKLRVLIHVSVYTVLLCCGIIAGRTCLSQI